MDMKLILVLLMGFIALGYASPRVRRDLMEPVPLEDGMGAFAIEPEEEFEDEDFEGSEQRYGGYGGGNRGGFGGGNRGGFGGGNRGWFGGGNRGGFGGGNRGGYGGGRYRNRNQWG